MSDGHVFQPVQCQGRAASLASRFASATTKGPQQLALVFAALVALACGSTGSDDNNAGTAGATPGGSSSGGSSGASQGSGGSSGRETMAGAAPVAGATPNAGAAGMAGAGGSATAAGAGGTTGTAAAAAGGTEGGLGCGDKTCGPNEYCRAACNGVFTGGSPSVGSPSCAPMPAACKGVPSCECVCGSATSLFCKPGAREIQCGCA